MRRYYTKQIILLKDYFTVIDVWSSLYHSSPNDVRHITIDINVYIRYFELLTNKDYSFIYMLLKLLEDKHFGKLDSKTIYSLANTNVDFSNLWLVHAIRSDCSLNELALAIAANIKWNTVALIALESYLAVGRYTLPTIPKDIEDAIAFSKEIISEFDAPRQAKLLMQIHTVNDKPSLIEPLGNNKYTVKIPATNEQIGQIIKTCTPHLINVSLFGNEGKNSKDESIRNNMHYPTPLPNDSIALALLERYLANASDISIAFAEPPVVLRYQPEQYYQWHYDYIYPHTNEIKQHLSQFGQRQKTAIFYLNDNFSGGETEFKKPFISVQPTKNRALVFDNCDALETRDTSSIHRGKSVTSGEKWIVTLWFRNKPFWLRQGLL